MVNSFIRKIKLYSFRKIVIGWLKLKTISNENNMKNILNEQVEESCFLGQDRFHGNHLKVYYKSVFLNFESFLRIKKFSDFFLVFPSKFNISRFDPFEKLPTVFEMVDINNTVIDLVKVTVRCFNNKSFFEQYKYYFKI